MANMKYNGHDLDPFLLVEKIERPLLTNITNHFVKIPDRYGELYRRNERGSSWVRVTVKLIKRTRSEVSTVAHTLRAIFYQTEPKWLELRDEPNYMQMAIIDGGIDFERLFTTGSATVTFVLPEAVYSAKNLTRTSLDANPHIYNGTEKAPFALEGKATGTTGIIITHKETGSTLKIAGGKAGETIRIDTWYQTVTVNGILAMHRLSMDSDFFLLQKGKNTFEIVNLYDPEITYRERYLA